MLHHFFYNCSIISFWFGTKSCEGKYDSDAPKGELKSMPTKWVQPVAEVVVEDGEPTGGSEAQPAELEVGQPNEPDWSHGQDDFWQNFWESTSDDHEFQHASSWLANVAVFQFKTITIVMEPPPPPPNLPISL